MGYDIIIIGAGPAGISMAVEARVAGVPADKISIIERAHEHSFSIKKYYPENKLVTANYKGFVAECTGVMCITDSSKQGMLSYIDDAIKTYDIDVRYSETVHKIHKYPNEQRFDIYTDKGMYEAKVITVAIGILGKPNKPEYKLPSSLKSRILFDLTSTPVANSEVLVVGGGDSASEYCQYLVQEHNRVTLSYRKKEFSRMNDINRKSLLALAERNQVELHLETEIAGVIDAEGKPQVSYRHGKFGLKTFDYIVYALGGTTPTNFLKTIGIGFDGEAPVLKNTVETNVPGMFLLGDLSAGPKGGSIIWAFNASQRAMQTISTKYLNL
jgi:thioredoxin reductase (NADPH)